MASDLLRTVVVCLASAAVMAQERRSLAGNWQIRADSAGAWQSVAVPAAFETALGVGFDGVARYRRTLPLPAERVARVRIEFAAVATHATVYCNGREVGQHLGGWTPFRVDVTPHLRWDGADELEVVVDERVGHNTQGFLPIIQPHFGGIWQGVTLCLDRGPVLDRLAMFLHGTADGTLRWQIATLAAEPPDLRTEVSVHAEAELGRFEIRGGAGTGTWRTPGVVPWSPANPQLYTARVRLLAGDAEIDRVETRIGYRDFAADGTRVLWNGAPLSVRGLLHWGYSPPHLAPPTDRDFWREQLTRAKQRGFNLLKCCLWVPPRCVYELCDELGLLVWQEYPTWHPQMDQAHKQELLAEYGEFFQHDRSHPSVAFRSITCETGHGADLDVVKSLYDACKAAVPNTLVVDDSSWIGWQRVTDFWDEHPYGNNSWWPGRLVEFQRHIAEKGAKPLVLGECIAADTWVDSAAWRNAHAEASTWWRPDCWQPQQAVEQWLSAEFGDATLRTLLPDSLDFAMRNRKFQIEWLRMTIPDAGYVVSVARDFAKARMGLDDDLGRPKWPTAAWDWHGDTMLCLDLPWHARALAEPSPTAAVRVVHHGAGMLQGQLRLWTDDPVAAPQSHPIALAAGLVGDRIVVPMPKQPDSLRRVRLFAELTGTHAARNHWDLWLVPAAAPRDRGVRHVDRLTPQLLDELAAGGNVVLHAGDRPGSLRTESLWFLRGAPFAPPHPIHALVPRELLLELSSFDLETTRVMPWRLRDEIDPVLAFWETHDIPEVRLHLFAGTTRVGKGRLLVSTLRLDGPQHGLGVHLRQLFEQHLVDGPPPRKALTDATIAAMRAQMTAKQIELPVWRFRTDPDDQGRAANWQAVATAVDQAPWRDLRAGSHWENQAKDLEHYTGVAWYRIDVPVPADWADLAVRAVFDGVDDSFELWLNGEPAGRFGDPATKTTIWLERQVAELGTRLRPGQVNTLVLRVVDHAGAGGLWKPAFLTTGPAGTAPPLLH